ncbi:MAG: exodeoxyribonuclease III [Planctomycetota bacterium]|nr:exodeoxyribonuclease III [Planctomycetota bacterium]
MILATWNVNSIRSRRERLLAWLDRARPDVFCLQELKCTDEAFPYDELARAGYHAAVSGQKTYNGVAILAQSEPGDVCRRLDDDEADAQARFVSARVGAVAVLCVYVPNGQVVGSEAWAYKLAWLARLAKHVRKHYSPGEPLVLCGDTNVARDDLDVDRPAEWADTVICHPDARAGLHGLLDWGLADVFRDKHPEGKTYSFWDYRNLDFPRNNGLRIDHILATAPLARRCVSAEIDREERKVGQGGEGGKPSDHAPVVAVFQD